MKCFPVLLLLAVLLGGLEAFAKPKAETSEQVQPKDGHNADAEDQSFLNPPQVISNPGPEFGVATRRFQGISSMARAPKGRLWATWYGGPGKGEDGTNYVILVTSGDDGKTWSDEALVVDPDGDGPVRAFDPELWVDPTGRLWLFWAQARGHDASVGGVWAITADSPDAAEPTWSAPRRLTDGVMMCKPIVLSSGEWVLPASTWRKTDNSAKMIVSTDEGQTWTERGSVNVPKAVRNYDEHMIVERKDGTLWMLIRTKYGIGESISKDRGKTWTECAPLESVPHTASRFFIHRLDSGNILLVKHGPITKQTGRSQLSAFVSKDDGASWTGGLMLDDRKGVSYPDGVQGPDGRIYITYDYNRGSDREILMAVFSEADILAGKPSESTRLQETIQRFPKGDQPAVAR